MTLASCLDRPSCFLPQGICTCCSFPLEWPHPPPRCPDDPSSCLASGSVDQAGEAFSDLLIKNGLCTPPVTYLPLCPLLLLLCANHRFQWSSSLVYLPSCFNFFSPPHGCQLQRVWILPAGLLCTRSPQQTVPSAGGGASHLLNEWVSPHLDKWWWERQKGKEKGRVSQAGSAHVLAVVLISGNFEAGGGRYQQTAFLCW